MPQPLPETCRIVVKRYAAGKAYGFMRGDSKWADEAAAALGRSLTIVVHVDATRFRALMAEQGVPEWAVERYLESAEVDDEAWLQNEMPR